VLAKVYWQGITFSRGRNEFAKKKGCQVPRDSKRVRISVIVPGRRYFPAENFTLTKRLIKEKGERPGGKGG